MTDTIIKIKTAGSIGKENEAEIKREYLRRVDKNISTQDFGDWCSYKNHSDVGYYLGCEFVKYLQRQYRLVDIASLNVNQLYNHFRSLRRPNNGRQASKNDRKSVLFAAF